jgi:hypothetical protein
MNTPHDQSESLPADIAPIGAALDRLGAAERGAMPASLATRIAATAPVRGAAGDLTPRLEALSTRERMAASSTLEDRVFMATRGLITGAGRVHEPGQRGGRERGRRVGWVGRLAIAAGLLLAVGLTLPLLRTTTPGGGGAGGGAGGGGSERLASAIATDLDELAEMLDTTGAREDVAGLNVALRSVEEAMGDELLRPAGEDGGSL